MSIKLFAKSLIGLSFIAIAALTPSQTSFAQSRVNDKVSRNNGASYFANQRTSRNIQHARDYSNGITRYATESPSIQSVVIHAESQVLGRQLQAMQRDLKIVREECVSNPKVVEQVKKIETQLGQVMTVQKSLEEECCKTSPDGKMCAEMCGKIHESLNAMKKEHDKLLKELGHEDAAYHPADGHKHDQHNVAEKKPEK
ncbi:MAG: hypothetical protein RLY14_953 [Planctomycetota bacterium]|jgi:flagellar motility protein MotE (MotC chaperone)